MFKFLKKSTETKPTWMSRFRDGLERLVLGKKAIDADLLGELESILLSADVGIETTQKILTQLTQKTSRQELSNSESLINELKKILYEILAPCVQPLNINTQPFILLVIGVNGTGKTTTIAKLAHYFKNQNKSVMLAAGDTFRAAAIEQLQTWGNNNQIPVIAQQSGADSASVIYDAVQSATAKNIDVLIADTAGRLHTQENLMMELQKIKRIVSKLNSQAPHEILLVLDAGTGQNALHQARDFHQSMGVTGIALTKLDGSAKGGIIFALCEKFKLPIRFIGLGEKIEDLKPFDAQNFIDALFGELKL